MQSRFNLARRRQILIARQTVLEPVEGQRTLTLSILGSDGSDHSYGGLVETTETYEDGAPLPDAWVMDAPIAGQRFMGIEVGNFVGTDMMSLGMKQRGVQVDEDGRFGIGRRGGHFRDRVLRLL